MAEKRDQKTGISSSNESDGPTCNVYYTHDGKTTTKTTGRIMKSFLTEFISTFFPWTGAFYQQPMRPAKGKIKHSSNWTDRLVRLVTQIFGYCYMYCFIYMWTWIWTKQDYFNPRSVVFHLIHSFGMFLFPVTVDEIQRRYVLKWWLPEMRTQPYEDGETWLLLLDVWRCTGLPAFIFNYPWIYFGYVDWHYDIMSLDGFLRFGKEYVISLLFINFICFQVLHTMAHVKPSFGLYAKHKKHHTVKSTVTSLRGHCFTFVDHVSEGICFYSMLVPFMSWLGYEKLHFFMFPFTNFTFHIIAHGTNPYYPLNYNPILDHFINFNVAHVLHHSVNRGHFSALPLHHLFGGLQRDIDEYNKVMRVDYTFQ